MAGEPVAGFARSIVVQQTPSSDSINESQRRRVKTPPFELKWKVDECADYGDRMRFSGWCFAEGPGIEFVEVIFPTIAAPIRLKSYGLPSPDVALAISPTGHHARFAEWLPLTEGQRGQDFTVRFHLSDGTIHDSEYVHENARAGDVSHKCWIHFLDALNTFRSGQVLELGARARSGITRRKLVPAQLGYVGFDIVDGPNVDVVGDAHRLSSNFRPNQFCAAFALSVFEHLAMPWKVVIELNRVLADGALVFVQSPQTYPLHDEPWDFWRFSIHSWPCLFNRETGFEIIEVAHGEPARIHPSWDAPVVARMCDFPSYLSSTVIARKVSATALDWNVPTANVATGTYPGLSPG